MTTLRERIGSAILNYYEILDTKWEWFDGFMKVIEQEIAIAEKNMKERCLNCIPNETPLSQLDTMSQKDIKEAENSLIWEINNSISQL